MRLMYYFHMPVWRFIYFHITDLFIDGRDSSFQLSVAFHVETSHLIYSAKQMDGFCMKSSTRLKWLGSRAQIDIITNSNKYILVPYNGERDSVSYFVGTLDAWSGLRDQPYSTLSFVDLEYFMYSQPQNQD